MDRVGAVIQARMGSTRLPEKVLRMICGLPMFERIHRRARAAAAVDETIVATTTNPEDDEIEAYCGRRSIEVSRGSEWDLLSRFLGAAHRLDVDVAVRIWGDCPCIPPSVVDRAVARLVDENLDYVSTFHDRRTFPLGTDLEAYRRSALDRIDRATDDEFYRQYFYEYVIDNEDKFRIGHLENDPDASDISVTVDYLEDLAVVRQIYADLGANAPPTPHDNRGTRCPRNDADPFDLEDLIEYCRDRPDLLALTAERSRNAEYREQKSERRDGE
jgi:spore coat polysaccharide biosynthesis protein SpsF (cytidylyltransferase family)